MIIKNPSTINDVPIQLYRILYAPYLIFFVFDGLIQGS